MFRQTLFEKGGTAPDSEETLERSGPALPLFWERIAFAAILLIAALLNLFNLQVAGDGNIYYTAAVKSMLTSWHNFFFVSFDSAGFVSVDKPPLGLWVQAASAKLFGVSGFSVILPEALAGVIAIALLYYLVRRAFGAGAGLLAALILALMPVSIAVNRDNLVDSILVLLVLLSVWAASRAVEDGRLRWLLLSAVFLGLAFNVKTLEAYLVLPALGLVYLFGAPLRWRARFLHLALALVVLLVISFAWITAVDLTPATQRPYVGSSQSNSELELTFGYNGIQRVLGTIFGNAGHGSNTPNMPQGGFPPTGGLPAFPGGTAPKGSAGALPGSGQLPAFPGGGAFGSNGTSGASPLRLFGADVAGQVSWLLPLAFLGLLMACWQIWRVTERGRRLPVSRRKQSLVLWGSWFLTTLLYFSIAGATHPYYLSMFAPCLAAVAAPGLVVLWEAYRRPGWPGWCLPLVLLITAAGQVFILSSYPTWSTWMTPLILALSLLAAVVLSICRLKLEWRSHSLARVSITFGVLALLIAPTTWSILTVQQAGGLVPSAGPGQAHMPGFGVGDKPTTNATLERYLLAHQGNARFLAATLNATSAAPLILDTGQAVMAMGGFLGSDPILTRTQLAQLVANGSVRFFVLSPGIGNQPGGPSMDEIPPQIREIMEEEGFSPPGGIGGFGHTSDLTQWVTQHCQSVPTTQTGGTSVYDCAPNQ